MFEYEYDYGTRWWAMPGHRSPFELKVICGTDGFECHDPDPDPDFDFDFDYTRTDLHNRIAFYVFD